MATSQTAWYVHNPKRSHELALEQIVRYLKVTIKEGLIFKLNRTTDKFKIEIYVDTAFPSG